MLAGSLVCEQDWQKLMKSANTATPGAPVRKGKVGRPRRSREWVSAAPHPHSQRDYEEVRTITCLHTIMKISSRTRQHRLILRGTPLTHERKVPFSCNFTGIFQAGTKKCEHYCLVVVHSRVNSLQEVLFMTTWVARWARRRKRCTFDFRNGTNVAMNCKYLHSNHQTTDLLAESLQRVQIRLPNSHRTLWGETNASYLTAVAKMMLVWCQCAQGYTKNTQDAWQSPMVTINCKKSEVDTGARNIHVNL